MGEAADWGKNSPRKYPFPSFTCILLSRLMNKESKVYYVKKIDQEKLKESDQSILSYLDQMKRIALYKAILTMNSNCTCTKKPVKKVGGEDLY